MYKKYLFYLIFIAALSFIWECKRERINPFDPKAVQISENTKLPEENPDLKKEETQIRGDTLYLIYRPGAPKPTFNPGDIVVGTAKEGYLKKVISSKIKGDTVILITTQACLTEAIIYGGIEETFTLMPEEKKMKLEPIRKDTIIIGDDGKEYRYYIEADAPQIFTVKGDIFEIRIPNVEIIIYYQSNLAAVIRIEELVLSEKINIDFKLIIDNGIDEFRFIARKTEGIRFKNVNIDLKYSIPLIDKSKPLLPPLPLGKIVFSIGPVPVVITFALRVDGGASLELILSENNTIWSDVTSNFVTVLGAEYKSGRGWHPHNQLTLNGNGNWNFTSSASISLKNKNYVRVSLDTKFYGAAGPFLYGKPYQYNQGSFPPISFEGGIGMSMGFGFKLEILDWKLAEYSRDFIDFKLLKLYEISPGGNNPPNTPSTPSGPSTGDVNVSYSFSSSATDPDGDDISIRFDWGDGSYSPWSSFVSSGAQVVMSHSWSTAGTYYIKAQAKDIHGAISNWSSGHAIVISGGGLVWSDDFETYSAGSWPSPNWINSGNDSGYVDNVIYYSGTKSLKLYGIVGVYWATLAHRQLATGAPWTLECYVRNGTEPIPETGHQSRARIEIHKNATWTSPARGLLYFHKDGYIYAGENDLPLMPYQTATWYKVKIKYEYPVDGQVRITYWINDVQVGQYIFSPKDEEANLSYLSLSAQAGSAWYDDVRISR